MDELTPENQAALCAQLEESRARRDALLREREAVEAEIATFAAGRQQYTLLQDICAGLEKLDELGATDAFWGDRAGNGWPQQHLQGVRARVDAFQTELNLVEQARQSVLERLLHEEETAEWIEEELHEAERAEEERKLEWILEREIGGVPERPGIMPWARGLEDDIRFRKSLGTSLALSLLIGLILSLVDLPVPERWDVIEVPERFTRLVREHEPPEPEPLPVREEEPKLAETEPEATDVVAPVPEEAQKPNPAPKTVPVAKDPAPKGILVFREQFAALAERDPTPRLGSQARIRDPGEVASGRPQRAIVTTSAPGTSGGIDIASLSREIGGGGAGIEEVQVSRATSSIGGGGGSDRPLSGGPGPARTDEEIQIVFDRHKAALYRLYNRALRSNPTLKGQMVLRLRIETDGGVSLCEIQSTDMNAPKLGEQVVARVKTFDFGEKEGVPAITIVYPIDFLPAT